MQNLRILKSNLFDGYATLTMAVGASAAGFALTNLLTDAKGSTWRSTNLTSPKIKVTWAAAQTLSGVALAFTNLISGSTFRVKLYDDPTAGTLLLDSGVVTVSYSYEAPRGFASIGSAAFAYGGGANVSTFFTSTAGVRRMEIEFTSVSNPDGYIEVSRVIAGAAWTPTDNADYGATTSFVDSTTGFRTSAGNWVTDRGTISRVMDFSMQAMGDVDKAALNNVFRYSGKSQPLFISLLPQTNAIILEEQLSQQIYGKLDVDMVVTLPFYQRYSSTIRIVEI